MAYGPWGHKELDMTERLTFLLSSFNLPFLKLISSCKNVKSEGREINDNEKHPKYKSQHFSCVPCNQSVIFIRECSWPSEFTLLSVGLK